jgi:hypothetical protein
MYWVKAQDNAAAMLATQATKLGTFGEDTFYYLDGKAWRITVTVGDPAGQLVYRSDDDMESQTILRMCRQAGFPGNRACTGCNTQFGINPTVGAHRRGYCSDKCEATTD